MRILVTGGAGFIGSHIVDQLTRRGDDVLVVDDLSTGVASNVDPSVALEQRHIGEEPIRDLFTTWRPTAVVHAAAQVSVLESISDPVRDAKANVVGGLAVLQAASDIGCRSFIYLNTGGALYADLNGRPAVERDRVAPVSPYGVSKWAFERYLPVLAPSAMGWTSLRLANVYGPRQRSDGEGGVVSIFATQMLRGRPVEIHGDGRQQRDFVYVSDVADAVLASLPAKQSLIVNIGTGIATSVLGLFQTLAEITGYSASPIHVESRPGDVRQSCLAVGLAARALNWRPTVDLRDGLRRTTSTLNGEREHGLPVSRP